MKEMVTVRFYEGAKRRACCDGDRYCPAEDVLGWDYDRGDQIGLRERDGGYLMGVIDRIRPDILVDATGRYRVAELWTQD